MVGPRKEVFDEETSRMGGGVRRRLRIADDAGVRPGGPAGLARGHRLGQPRPLHPEHHRPTARQLARGIDRQGGQRDHRGGQVHPGAEQRGRHDLPGHRGCSRSTRTPVIIDVNGFGFPNIQGRLDAVAAAEDGTSVFISGNFAKVDGVVNRKLAKLDVATGRPDHAVQDLAASTARSTTSWRVPARSSSPVRSPR